VLLVPHSGAVIAGNVSLPVVFSCFFVAATFSLSRRAGSKSPLHGIGVQSVIKRLPIMVAPFFGGLFDRFVSADRGVRIALVIFDRSYRRGDSRATAD